LPSQTLIRAKIEFSGCDRHYKIKNVRAEVNQNYKEKFEISTGVKQGDPLSATLFSIVIDDILKQLKLRGKISTRLKQCSAYADDILITAGTKQTMTDTFEKLKNISLQFGLIVNENKKKYMECTRKETQLDRLTVENIQTEQVRSFSCLGTIVNGNNTLKEEIRERIVKGNKAFYANKILFKSNLVSRKSKLKLYSSVIGSIFVYGCEIWVPKESVVQRLSVFERRILRKIFGPTKENNGIWRIKTNMELDELIKHRNVINYVKAKRLSWFGHTNRMAETGIVKEIYKWKPFTGRPVGRPKSRWEDDVGNDLKKMKFIKWAEQVQDRLKLKDIVEKAKTVPKL
jgi:hypothetical protein